MKNIKLLWSIQVSSPEASVAAQYMASLSIISIGQISRGKKIDKSMSYTVHCKIHILNSNLQCYDIWRWGLWR